MITKDTTKRDPHIDWHSAFYDAIQMELAEDWDINYSLSVNIHFKNVVK